jgi:hypothetical protein
MLMFLSPLGERLGEGTGVDDPLDLRPYALVVLNYFVRPKTDNSPTFTFGETAVATEVTGPIGVVVFARHYPLT